MATMTRQQRRKQERLSKKNQITDEFSNKVKEIIYNASINTLSTTKCVVKIIAGLNITGENDIALIYLSDDGYVVVDEIDVNTHKVKNVILDYKGEDIINMCVDDIDTLRDLFLTILYNEFS